MEEDNYNILETTYWIVKLNPDQYYPGRSVVILKRNCGNLSELNKEEVLDFFEIVKKLENSIKKSLGAEMFNWTCLMNDAYKMENPQPQVHWHVRPRYRKKLEISGEIFEDKEFAHHYKRKTDKEVSEEVKKEIIRRIKESLKNNNIY